MSRRRDPLDGPLTRLCSLAEQTAVLLTRIERARMGFQTYGFDPDAIAAELVAKAAAGREAHLVRNAALRDTRLAELEAAEAAEAAYEAQRRFRDRLFAAAVVLGDPVAAADLEDVRRRLRLTRPRAVGALDAFRRLRDHLADPSHPVHAHEVTAGIPEEVGAHVRRLHLAVVERDRALRQRRIAVGGAEACWTELRQLLRKVRRMGELAVSLERVPDGFISHLRPPRRRSGRRRDDEALLDCEGGSEPSDEGAAGASEGATGASEGAAGASEGAASATPGAAPANQGAAGTSDPTRPSSGSGDPSAAPGTGCTTDR
ncbi:MAG: hypothetical protein H6732_07760 [Alphaproteobacteria bacterium]|nr:hypothetical protein [Alphaproteobacteria bacterium]